MADENGRKVILQRKIQDVLADRSKINYIVDIIDELSSSDTLVVVECIDGLGKIFTTLIQSETCPVRKASKVLSKKAKIADQPEEIFEEWITQSYDQTVKTLLALLQSPCREIAEKALCTVMVFLKAESQKLQESSQGFAFSSDLFLKLVTKLTGCLYINDAVVKFFKPYLRYNDICYYTLRNLTKIISKFTDDQKQGDIQFARSVYHLLMLISVPTCEDDLGSLFVIFTEETEPNPKTIKHNVMNLNSYKKVFTRAWMAFLALTLDNGLYRQVLVVLEDKVIPHLVDPKILMDFLVDSYNIGGVTSILALNSLFVLIHKYNLDYPDFYKKLYSLLQAEIFHMKYRARFFFLADLFLMSTHLPAYLVAAFIKRLSRLALRVPPYGVALIVKFVGNLIRRHPNCKVLIHRKNDKVCFILSCFISQGRYSDRKSIKVVQ